MRLIWGSQRGECPFGGGSGAVPLKMNGFTNFYDRGTAKGAVAPLETPLYNYTNGL